MAKNPQRGSGRIVGGTEASPNAYPHLVFLLIDSLYVCGGNIFNENTIITAAHCADGARRVEITAGAHDQSVNEPTQQVVISTSHIEHPDWNSFTLQGDVAILYLDSPLEFTNEIGSIALASAEPAVGEPVNMAGWGKTCDQINCGVSDVVNEVTVPVLDDQVAEDYYGSHVHRLADCWLRRSKSNGTNFIGELERRVKVQDGDVTLKSEGVPVGVLDV